MTFLNRTDGFLLGSADVGVMTTIPSPLGQHGEACMPTTRRQWITRTAASALSLNLQLSTAMASDAAFPNRPITIVVAYPAGGDTDVLARLLGERLSIRLGQPVVVENRSGAAGTIGTTFVAKAPADGYTLLLAPNTVAIAPHVMKSGKGAGYNPVTDLTPIVELGTQSLYVVVASSLGVRSVPELIAAIKAGRIQTYASPGNGSPMHILAELFNKAAGVGLAQVPYRGSMPAVADMVGGHVPMMFSTLGPVAAHVASGKLQLIGIADAQRSHFQPSVPTLAEQGVKGAEVGAWQALMGPKGLPPQLVALLNTHCNEILQLPDASSTLQAVALHTVGGNPAVLQRLISNDFERYAQLVKEFGIRAD